MAKLFRRPWRIPPLANHGPVSERSSLPSRPPRRGAAIHAALKAPLPSSLALRSALSCHHLRWHFSTLPCQRLGDISWIAAFPPKKLSRRKRPAFVKSRGSLTLPTVKKGVKDRPSDRSPPVAEVGHDSPPEDPTLAALPPRSTRHRCDLKPNTRIESRFSGKCRPGKFEQSLSRPARASSRPPVQRPSPCPSDTQYFGDAESHTGSSPSAPTERARRSRPSMETSSTLVP